MQVDEQTLIDIKRIAAAGYTPEQTAFRLGLDADEFMQALNEDDDPVSIAYFQGLNSVELAVRESVYKLAIAGSSPAQTLAVKILDETRKTLLKNGIAEKKI